MYNGQLNAAINLLEVRAEQMLSVVEWEALAQAIEPETGRHPALSHAFVYCRQDDCEWLLDCPQRGALEPTALLIGECGGSLRLHPVPAGKPVQFGLMSCPKRRLIPTPRRSR